MDGSIASVSKEKRVGFVQRSGGAPLIFREEDLPAGVEFDSLKKGTRVYYEERLRDGVPSKFLHYAGAVRPVS